MFFNMYFYGVLIPKYILMINILNYSLKSEQFIYKSIIFAILLMTTTMTQVSLKTIEQNDNVGMFSICFDGNSESEFEKFLLEFKDNATYNKDFNAILLALSKIIDKGALERFFRIEGRMNDHVSALSIDSRKLRLYCLRISDQILILGNTSQCGLNASNGLCGEVVATSEPFGNLRVSLMEHSGKVFLGESLGFKNLTNAFGYTEG